jgi:hypothetical protein
MNLNTANGIVIAGGVLLEVLAIRNIFLAHSSKQWLKVPGQVIQSVTEENRQADSDGGSTVSYRPKIKYSYEYEGRTYSGKRIGYSVIFGSRKESDRLVRNFHTGKKIQVYMHPQKPKQSVILTGIDISAAFISLVAPPIFIFIGLLIVRELHIRI